VTNCTLPQSINFSKINRKIVEAKFNGGSISSDAGLLLLREVDNQIKLISRVSKCICDNRHSSYIKHEVETLLRQRVYGIAAGYEDVNDQDSLRDDLCFQTCVGKERQLGSSSTISRFENSIDRETIVKLSKEMVESFIKNHKGVPEELVLDFDPTDNKIHGHQDKRHYHGYYKNYCYLPLHVFCGDQLIVSMLRPSDIDGAKYAGAILKLLVKRFRETWPGVNIVFRGDSGFARRHILHWCENNDVGYIVGMPANARLQSIAKYLTEQAETNFIATQEKQKLFGDFFYEAGTWNNKRRIVVKAEHNANGSNTRFVVTNLTEFPDTLYSKKYCLRGDMENKIKQLKLDLHSDRNSCKDFYANYFRVLLSSLAYVLLTELKTTHLKLTRLAKAYCGTIRLKLLKVGAVIIKNSRRITFFLSATHPHKDDFIVAAQSLVPT
jgi:hypothetical protein